MGELFQKTKKCVILPKKSWKKSARIEGTGSEMKQSSGVYGKWRSEFSGKK